LLPDEDRVAPNDSAALAAKIREVVTNPEQMNSMASRNWRKATEYEESNLRARRHKLYTVLREATQQWLAGDRKSRGVATSHEIRNEPTQNLPAV
jgi:hypothetical protein